MTGRKSKGGSGSALALLESVNQLRFYRNGPALPQRAQPLDPWNPGCKWYFVRLGEGERGRPSPVTAGSARSIAWLLPLLRRQLVAERIPNSSVVVLRPAKNLTGLLKRSEVVRAAWWQALPHTTHVVREVNRSVSKILHVPRSTWTKRLGRSGVVGNAYDYAVGSLWARDDLRSVFQRVRVATMRLPRVRAVFATLELMLRKEIDAVARGAVAAPPPDYFRGLVLLAELDAMSRAPVDAPRWISGVEANRITEVTVRRLLEENYPDDVAAELSSLIHVTVADLRANGRLTYNPVFGGAPGFEHIGADGDVIVGGALFELKASIRPYECDHLWQLLGYACLDRLHGRDRIRRVGLFNPRRRHLWTEDVDVFVNRLGGRSLDSFCQWFCETTAANRMLQLGNGAG